MAERRQPLDQRRASGRWPGRDHARRRHGGLVPGADLLPGLHARRYGLLALLRLHVALHDFDAGPDPRRQPGHGLRVLGDGRRLVLPAHRLLVRPAGRRGGGEEGVPRHPPRRPRLPAGDHPDLPRGRHVRHPRHPGARDRRHAGRHDADPVRARHLRRRRGQVRAVAVPGLAAGRHGRPDACQRPGPLRHDGRGRRLPRRAHVPRVPRVERRAGLLSAPSAASRRFRRR